MDTVILDICAVTQKQAMLVKCTCSGACNSGLAFSLTGRLVAGGDMLLTHCLWIAGHGITDPGASFHNPKR